MFPVLKSLNLKHTKNGLTADSNSPRSARSVDDIRASRDGLTAEQSAKFYEDIRISRNGMDSKLYNDIRSSQGSSNGSNK